MWDEVLEREEGLFSVYDINDISHRERSIVLKNDNGLMVSSGRKPIGSFSSARRAHTLRSVEEEVIRGFLSI